MPSQDEEKTQGTGQHDEIVGDMPGIENVDPAADDRRSQIGCLLSAGAGEHENRGRAATNS